MPRRKNKIKGSVTIKKRIDGETTLAKKPYNGAYAALHEKAVIFLNDFIKT